VNLAFEHYVVPTQLLVIIDEVLKDEDTIFHNVDSLHLFPTIVIGHFHFLEPPHDVPHGFEMRLYRRPADSLFLRFLLDNRANNNSLFLDTGLFFGFCFFSPITAFAFFLLCVVRRFAPFL
jgi:hypothetical protein